MLLGYLIATAITALAAPFLGAWLGRRAGWVLGPIVFGIGVAMWVTIGNQTLSESYAWIPALGVEFTLRLDGLGMLFALLVLLIGGAVLAYSSSHLSSGRHANFYGLMTLFASAMLGLVIADDVIVLFVMWEITTLCSFFLIARSGPAAREPALRTLLVTGAGGLSLLAAAVAMAVKAGSTQLSVILASDAWNDPVFAGWVAVAIAIAAFAKSAQFPFHAWLPDAMAAATPVSAYLHAAAMVKAGIYLMMRFSGVLGEVPVWNALLISAGLTTAIIGAIAALRRYDLKSMLAYSTVSQLGFLTAVIGIGTPEALAAAAIHTVAHALFKSSLFMLTGIIDHRASTRDIRILSHLRVTMPVTSGMVAISALSMAGVPPLLGFISKEGLFEAMLHAPGPAWLGYVVAGVGVFAAVLTFAYAARMVLGIWGGPAMDRPVREATFAYLLPVTLPTFAGLTLGLWAVPLNGLISRAAGDAMGVPLELVLSLWHGVNAPLILSAFVIMAGTGLVLARVRIDRLLVDRVFPFSALRVVDMLRVFLIRAGARVGDPTRTDSPNRHLAIPLVMLILLAGVGTFTIGPLPEVVGDTTRLYDWVLLFLLVIGVAGCVVARSRIAAITVIGVVGFGVTVWFFTLGAPDVALTQLLVEILTVVVVVLLLRRLPLTFLKATKRRTVLAAMLATGAGVATSLAVFAFTGRRELSEAGTYYVREAQNETGGGNIVNTILVDFRALDTLGEISVLAMAGVTIMVLVRSRTLLSPKTARLVVSDTSGLAPSYENLMFLRALGRLVGPLTIVLAIVFLFRGHNAPGGGFIAGLIGSAGVALLYLAAANDTRARIRTPATALMGSGVALAVLTGTLGFIEGSFLKPLHADILGVHLSTALVFDVGVFLVVVGIVVTALNLLGGETPHLPAAVTEPPLGNDADARHNVDERDDSEPHAAASAGHDGGAR